MYLCRRAADITGWTEPEIFAMPRFQNAIFSSQSSPGRDLTEDILKGAFDGQSNSSQEVWNLRSKWGQDLKVVVVASPRTDARGVSGALCVVMPLGAPVVKQQPDCNTVKSSSMEEVSQLDLEGRIISSLCVHCLQRLV